MTPRQADVAFVLEGVPGVRAVYAIKPGSSAARNLDFAIEIDPDQQQQAFAHYMLLRALTHPECERVTWLSSFVPSALGTALVPLTLTALEREAARARVRPVEPFTIFRTIPSFHTHVPLSRILIIDPDVQVVGAAREVFGTKVEYTVCWAPPIHALNLACSNNFQVILCDFARLDWSFSPDARERMIVVADDRVWMEAMSAVQDRKRLLKKPVDTFALQRCIFDVLRKPVLTHEPEPALTLLPQKPPPRPMRALRVASPKEPLRLLLVDVDAGIRETISNIFGPEAGEVVVAYGADAVERAFTASFHRIFCSATTALSGDGFLAAVRREDPVGVDRVIVVVPDIDAAFVKERLPANRVLRLPIDEALLRGLVGRVAPRTVERAAVAEIPAVLSAPAEHPRYRRLAVLVVDDDLDTQILFAAGTVADEADVALATTTLAAFEHLTSRPVDVLVVSAAMRSDGGEPFYRVIWRMLPALKAGTVLVTSLADAPKSDRLLARPLSRAALAEVVSRASR